MSYSCLTVGKIHTFCNTKPFESMEHNHIVTDITYRIEIVIYVKGKLSTDWKISTSAVPILCCDSLAPLTL